MSSLVLLDRSWGSFQTPAKATCVHHPCTKVLLQRPLVRTRVSSRQTAKRICLRQDAACTAAPRHAAAHPFQQAHVPFILFSSGHTSCSRLLATSTSSRSLVGTEDAQGAEAASRVQASDLRVRRLQILIALRKLYRNMLRAQGLLSQPAPIYSSDTHGPGRMYRSFDELDQEERDRRDAAVEIVAELQLTAEQLKADLRALSAKYGSWGDVFESQAKDKEEQIIKLVRDTAQQVSDRVTKEIRLLPYRSPREAQIALNARNARYKTAATRTAQTPDDVREDSRELGERLGAAEKAVEKFVAKRIQPAVQKAVKTPVRRWAAGVRTGADYVKGVWIRLNGGGRRADVSIEGFPDGLQMPTAPKEARSAATKALSVEISSLEKRLQDSSKAREQRLRKAGVSERARMAGQLRNMDDEVLVLSRTLAVKTLQLEMEYIFGSLEDEALDVAQGTSDAGFLLSRTGSSDEVALLIAEFGLLDNQLAGLWDAIERGHGALLDEDNLARLAVDIPDLRVRLGIVDAVVFGGSGWTFVRFRASVSEAFGKVGEGVSFFLRGIRLLGSDLSSAGRLFSRAVLGASLKSREVTAIRRTARDLLTFVPFAIILIAPITPIGHVLVFSFIQKYFPGFFPSQFTSRRQELMIRYEELKHRLEEAQEAAAQEDEEAELARATAAVARLTAPVAATNPGVVRAAESYAKTASGRKGKQPGKKVSNGSSEDPDDEGPAAKALRNLEQEVAAAAEQTLSNVEDT